MPIKTFRGFSMSIFFRQTAQAMIAQHIDCFRCWSWSRWLIGNRSSNTWIDEKPLSPRPLRPSRLSPVVHIQSRPARTTETAENMCWNFNCWVKRVISQRSWLFLKIPGRLKRYLRFQTTLIFYSFNHFCLNDKFGQRLLQDHCRLSLLYWGFG